MITDYFKEIQDLNSAPDGLPVEFVEYTTDGELLAANEDGSIIVSMRRVPNGGFLDFYKRSITGYTMYASINHAELFGSASGASYGLSYDSERDIWFISAHWQNGTSADEGRVYLYRIGMDGSMTKLQELKPTDGGNPSSEKGGFGVRTVVSHDNKWLYVGQYQKSLSTLYGHIYVYELTDDKVNPAVYRSITIGGVSRAHFGASMGTAKTSNIVAVNSYSDAILKIYSQEVNGTLTLDYQISLGAANKLVMHDNIEFSADDSFMLARRESDNKILILRKDEKTGQYVLSTDTWLFPSLTCPVIRHGKVLTRVRGTESSKITVYDNISYSSKYNDPNLNAIDKTISSSKAELESYYYGSTFAISDDERVIAIGAFGAQAGRGWFEVWMRKEIGYDYEMIYAGEGASGDTGASNGVSIDVSTDGRLVAVGSIWSNAVGTDAGRVVIYDINDDRTVTTKQILTPGSNQNGQGYGSAVSFTTDSRWLIVTQYNRTVSGKLHAGGFYAYEFDDVEVAHLKQVVDGTVGNSYFGMLMTTIRDEKTLAVLSTMNNVNEMHFYKLNESNIWGFDYKIGLTATSFSGVGPQNKVRSSLDGNELVLQDKYGFYSLTRDKETGRFANLKEVTSELPKTDSTPLVTANNVWFSRPPYSGLVRRSKNQFNPQIQLPKYTETAFTKAIQSITEDNKLQMAVSNLERRHVEKYTIAGADDYQSIDGAPATTYGCGMSMSRDGKWLAVGGYRRAVDGLVDAGVMHMYQRVDDQWVHLEKIVSPECKAGGYFGWAVALNGDGTTMAITETNLDAGKVSKIHLYVREGLSWKHLTTTATKLYTNHADANYLALTDDGLTLYATSPDFVAVDIYNIEENTIVYKEKITGFPGIVHTVAVDGSGDTLVVGLPVSTNSVGLVRRNKATGKLEWAGYKFSTEFSNPVLGTAAFISGDATIVIVGSQNNPSVSGTFTVFKYDLATDTYRSTKQYTPPGLPVNNHIGCAITANNDATVVMVGSHISFAYEYRSATDDVTEAHYLVRRMSQPEELASLDNLLIIKVSPDGKTLATANLTTADINFYTKLNNKWEYSHRIDGSVFENKLMVGYGLTFSEDNQYLWVSSMNQGYGSLRKCSIKPGQGVIVATVSNPVNTNINWGSDISLDYNRHLMIVGSYSADSGKGRVSFYSADNMKVIYPDLKSPFFGKVVDEHFGYRLISLKNDLLLISALNGPYSDIYSHGMVYLAKLNHTMNQFNVIQAIKSPKPVESGHFGAHLHEIEGGVVIGESTNMSRDGRMQTNLHKYVFIDEQLYLEESITINAEPTGCAIYGDDLVIRNATEGAILDCYQLTGELGIIPRCGDKAPHSLIDDNSLVMEPTIPVSL